VEKFEVKIELSPVCYEQVKVFDRIDLKIDLFFTDLSAIANKVEYQKIKEKFFSFCCCSCRFVVVAF